MTSTVARRACVAIKRDGQPCGSWAISGSNLCHAHDPAHAASMADARHKAGLARHGRRIGTTGESAPVHLVTLADVCVLLERAANDLYRLENSVSRGRAIVSLASAFVDAYQTSELERRVAALEARNL